MERPEAKKPEFEIISVEERIARDPRGLQRFTKLGKGRLIVKKALDNDQARSEPASDGDSEQKNKEE